MSDLDNYSDAELIQELARRNHVHKDDLPQPLENPDFSVLIQTCKDHIFNLSCNTAIDSDEHDICEAAIESIYGPMIWIWLEQQKGQ